MTSVGVRVEPSVVFEVEVAGNDGNYYYFSERYADEKCWEEYSVHSQVPVNDVKYELDENKISIEIKEKPQLNMIKRLLNIDGSAKSKKV